MKCAYCGVIVETAAEWKASSVSQESIEGVEVETSFDGAVTVHYLCLDCDEVMTILNHFTEAVKKRGRHGH